MTNSEAFINAYNKIDTFLNDVEDLRGYESFTKKVLRSRNKTVKRFSDELISYGRLRNAIVHNPRFGEFAIAEPHEDTVKRIELLCREITEPGRVFPEYKAKIIFVRENDYLTSVLKKMNEHSFSRISVYNANDRLVEVINSKTLAHWMASHLEGHDAIPVKDVLVKDLFPFISAPHNYRFISKDTTFYDAFDLFIESIQKEKRSLDVLYITEHGRPDEPILGLLTLRDIAKKAATFPSTELI